ncbi:Mss4-like protein [Xylaria longipes]|nr:Mss4-like protein [Xylaria longipes]
MAAPVTEEKGDEALELAAHCLCQAQRFTAQVPRSSLPLEAAYCHCTSCRRVTGALYSSTYIHTMAGRRGGHPRITVAPALRLLGPLDALLLRPTACRQTSVPPNVAVRGLVDIAHHVFLSDTLVGGASPWLCDANSSDGGQSQELLLPSLHRHWPAAETGASLPSEDTDIPVRCHCGGVDLVLRQPIADFAARKERSELPWFIDPVSNEFWDGRSQSQSQTHTNFPESSLELKTAVSSTADKRDSRWGTLTFFESSPDVQWYFCSRCSASVLYASNDRPEMEDLASGLLSAGDRDWARAEHAYVRLRGGRMETGRRRRMTGRLCGER